MTMVISLLNHKGGVGKTTCAVTLGTGLARRGARVLVIDTDAQAHASTQLGVKESNGLYRLLVQDAYIDEVAQRVPDEVWRPKEEAGELFVVPSNMETRGISAVLGEQQIDYLRLILRGVEARTFDYVVIDTSPTSSPLHTMVYLASDVLLLPAIPEMLALDGLAKSVMVLQGHNRARALEGLPELSLLGVQPTLSNISRAHKYGLAKMREFFGEERVLPPIRMRTHWRDASYAQQTIFAYSPNSIAAREAAQMVEIVEHMLRGVAVHAA